MYILLIVKVIARYAKHYNLTDDEYSIILTKDIQVCRRCGVIFDLNIRKNKDCPLCSSGEHTKIRMNDVSNSKSS
jgi:predicted Zn-ribbon and HTH transcriptional regulator